MQHERQHVDSHSRGNYHQSGSEDRRPQEAWNRPHAEATSYPTRAAQARPAAALSGLGTIPFLMFGSQFTAS